MMLTDEELQSLRNMGNEAEAAADEIVRLSAMLAAEQADKALWVRRADKTWHERYAAERERERIAQHFDGLDKGVGGFFDPHEPAEIIRALGPNAELTGIAQEKQR